MRVIELREADLGMVAFLALDEPILGANAGGIRTSKYDDEAAARQDAERLARSMTLKCAAAGLRASGGKCVLMDQPGLKREAAFRRLGQAANDYEFHTSGDLGTTDTDLAAAASVSQRVHRAHGLADAVAQSIDACLRGCGVEPRRVAIQGCGSIGSALARLLANRGCELLLADSQHDRANALATALNAQVGSPDTILQADVDVLAPCAIGGVIGSHNAHRVRAPLVCGGANNILADDDAEGLLHQAGVAIVPDFLSSAGAVIKGIAPVTGQDATALIEQLAQTAEEIMVPRDGHAYARAKRLAEMRLASPR